jgi:hypothetical protein
MGGLGEKGFVLYFTGHLLDGADRRLHFCIIRDVQFELLNSNRLDSSFGRHEHFFKFMKLALTDSRKTIPWGYF